MPDQRPDLSVRRVQSAPEQIADNIKSSILDGTLKPGDRLPSEPRLAELYGVSKPTVREALRALRDEGVLLSSLGRTGGHRVADRSLRALTAGVAEVISVSLGSKAITYAQLFEVRAGLEVASAGAAAARRTEDDLERLRAALPDPGALPEEADALLAADLVFHRTLAEATHNPLMVGLAGATVSAFRQFSDDVADVVPEAVIKHLDEIVEAVAARDVAGAEAAMRRHLAYFRTYFELDEPHA